MPIMAKLSGSIPPRTRLYSAGTTRRLVRSPPAPKMAITAGAGRRLEKHLAIAAASAANVGFALLSSPANVPWRLLRRDKGALSSRPILALLTVFPTNALGHRSFWRLARIGSNPQLRERGSELTAFDELGVSLDYFKLRFIAFGPEPDVELVLADAKIVHPQIWQPVRKRRIDIELIAGRIRLKSQQGLGQHEDGPGRPRLRHVGADILNRKIRLGALGGGIKFRQLIEQEVARRHAHIVRHARRLRSKAVELEPHGDDGVIVRPHRAGLIIVWIERPMIGGKRANAPSRPHVGRHQTIHYPLCTLAGHDTRPKAMAGVGGDGQDLVFVAVERIGVESQFLVPEGYIESLEQLGSLGTQ